MLYHSLRFMHLQDTDLMPASQQIYAAVSQLRFIKQTVDMFDKDIKNVRQNFIQQGLSKITFNKEISLNNISYSYPDQTRNALSNISFKISANTTVGLVGSSGSGKTTTVDIILGLLIPQKGNLTVDGEIICGL